jgi:hypothetical protein
MWIRVEKEKKSMANIEIFIPTSWLSFIKHQAWNNDVYPYQLEFTKIRF